jgi:hypothetical protein
MRLEQGDAFEQAHATWLRQELPHYETLWSAYIGHAGDGWPLPLANLTDDEASRRRKMYQAHYSAAVGCFQIDESLREIEARLGEVRDIDSFMREHRHLNSIMGWVGHVRDMYKQMDEALALSGAAYMPLQDFYALRSHIMHGPRMPIRIVDGLVQIPRVARQNKTSAEWDDKSYWEDFKGAEFVFLADFCTQTRAEFFSLVREMHAKTHSAACELFGSRRIVDRPPERHAFISASSAMPAISAWNPPSGNANAG